MRFLKDHWQLGKGQIKEGKNGMTKTSSLFLSSQRDGMGFGQEARDPVRMRLDWGHRWTCSIVNRANGLTEALNVKWEMKKGDKDATGFVGIFF